MEKLRQQTYTRIHVRECGEACMYLYRLVTLSAHKSRGLTSWTSDCRVAGGTSSLDGGGG